MKKLTLLSMAATLALATEPITIQKITVEANAPKTDSKNVDSDEMVKFSRQSDLGEMLSNTLPEVTLVRNSGVGNDIILRGLRKDNINVTIDDAKVCGGCPNRMDPPAMHVSSAQIASVEVQEGPFDVTQFGSLGGKINVVTKDPEKGIHGEVSATAGSFDYRKISTTLEGGNDTVQALVGFSRETSGQYQDGNGRTLAEQTDALTATNGQKYATAYKEMDAYERNNYWAKIVGNFGENQKLTFSYFGDRADNVLYPRYPMDAKIDNTDMFKIKYELLNLSALSEELTIEAYHSKVEHEMGTYYRTRTGPTSAVTIAPVDAMIQGASIENTLDLSGTKVSIGLDGSIRNWDGLRYSTANPAAKTILLPDVDTKNMAIYAKASKNIGEYELNGGIRYDDTTINPDQTKTGYSAAKEKEYNDVSANVMAKYNLTSTTSIFTGIGQSVRVPDAKELYWLNTTHSNLKETKNREIDVGAEHSAGNLHVKGTAFYSDLKDFIYQYKNSATTTSWTNIDAKIVGFDLQGDYLLTNDLRLESGMAYQVGSKKDTTQLQKLSNQPQSDKDLAEIPPLKGRVALVMDTGSNYFMGEWIGAQDQSIDSNNGEKDIGGYSILNLKYGHDFHNGFSLMSGVNNVLDRTYAVNNGYIGNELITGITGSTDPLVINEPGRSFYATLSYKF